MVPDEQIGHSRRHYWPTHGSDGGPEPRPLPNTPGLSTKLGGERPIRGSGSALAPSRFAGMGRPPVASSLAVSETRRADERGFGLSEPSRRRSRLPIALTRCVLGRTGCAAHPVNRACGGALNAPRRIRSRPKRRLAKKAGRALEVCDERDCAPPPDPHDRVSPWPRIEAGRLLGCKPQGPAREWREGYGLVLARALRPR